MSSLTEGGSATAPAGGCSWEATLWARGLGVASGTLTLLGGGIAGNEAAEGIRELEVM